MERCLVNKKIFLAAGLFIICVSFFNPENAKGASEWIFRKNETHGQWNITPAMTIIPWWYFAPGVRFGIPIAKNGFIPSLNDEFKIEIGFNYQFWWHVAWGGYRCDLYCDRKSPHYDPDACDRCKHDYYYFDPDHPIMRIALPAMMRWEFYLTKIWTVYGGFGFEIGIPINWATDPFGPHGWFWIVFVPFGTTVRISKFFAFRFELGTIGFPMIGFEFIF